MSIEIVRLKNGTEYPVSPIYRSPVVVDNVAKPMDYPFAYEAEPTGAGSVTIEITAGGQTTTDTLILYPLSTNQLSLAELASCTVTANNPLGKFFSEDPMVSPVSDLLKSYLLLNGVTLDNDDISAMSGTGAALSVATFVFAVGSFDSAQDPATSALTVSGETTVGGATIPVSVTITPDIPAAGSYWWSTLGRFAVGMSGTVNICTYDFDPRFCNGICKVNNYLLGEQLAALMESGGGTVSLSAYPTVSAKLLYAIRSAQPLVISAGMSTMVATMSALSINGSGGTWVAYMPDTGVAITLTYAYSDNPTLTLGFVSGD